jgi:hypothetical protein
MKTHSIGTLVLGIALCFMSISACDEESDDHSDSSTDPLPEPTATCQDDCTNYLQVLAECDLESPTPASCLEDCQGSVYTHLNLECVVNSCETSECEFRADCIQQCLSTGYA